jgi:hypothetical protein
MPKSEIKAEDVQVQLDTVIRLFATLIFEMKQLDVILKAFVKQVPAKTDG